MHCTASGFGKVCIRIFASEIMSFPFWSTNGSRISGIGGIAEEVFDVVYPQQGKVSD